MFIKLITPANHGLYPIYVRRHAIVIIERIKIDATTERTILQVNCGASLLQVMCQESPDEVHALIEEADRLALA